MNRFFAPHSAESAPPFADNYEIADSSYSSHLRIRAEAVPAPPRVFPKWPLTAVEFLIFVEASRVFWYCIL